MPGWRTFLILTTALLFADQAALADGPLAPGKPAGLAQAQMNNHQLFIYITLGGTVLVLAGGLLLLDKKTAAVAASSSGGAGGTGTTPPVVTTTGPAASTAT